MSLVRKKHNNTKTPLVSMFWGLLNLFLKPYGILKSILRIFIPFPYKKKSAYLPALKRLCQDCAVVQTRLSFGCSLLKKKN